jgi:hypothetical protein
MPCVQKTALSVASIFFGLSMLLQIAQARGSSYANIEILYANNPYLTIPATIALPSTFISPTSAVTIYQSFDPNNPDNQIKIYDYTNDSGFVVQLQVTNFTNLANRANFIPLTNLSLVTLARTNGQTVATAPFNNPPADDNHDVHSNYGCNWDFTTGNFQNSCAMNFYTLTDSGSGNSVPIELIDAALVPPRTGRIGEYWVSLGLKLVIPPAIPSGNYQSTFTFTLL